MRKIIKSPTPQLSELKEFNINLEMNGDHYRQLAIYNGSIPEETILSILKDLLDEDACKLTLTEARYLFMLVKIHALENDMKATVTCKNTNSKGEVCNHINEFPIKLSDADLNSTPKSYKLPKIKLITSGEEKEYEVTPPTIDMEIALYNWFLQEKGIEPIDIEDDKSTALDFTWLRSLMHLKDKDGNRLIKDVSEFEAGLGYLKENKFTTITHLYNYVNEVNSFGVQNKEYEFKCKECGGTIKFHLPLLYGLSL